MNPEYAAARKRLAAFLPKQEAPLVTESISTWSVPMSADKPRAKDTFKVDSKAGTDPDSKAASKAKKKATNPSP